MLNNPAEVIIDFRERRAAAMSAIEALKGLTHRYRKIGKKVYLCRLSNDCILLFKNAEANLDVNIM